MITCGTDNFQFETSFADFVDIRKYFPALKKYPQTIFFDNAATTQKPQLVIETMRAFYEDNCANANRAAYSLSNKLHHQIEETRYSVATFINAQSSDIAFTSGATDSLNLIATSWGLSNLCDGDEIMLCLDDHQSTILPWFNLKSILSKFDKTINIIPFSMHYSGIYNLTDIKAKISAKTRLISMSHIHHLYGLEWEAKDIAAVRSYLPEQALIALDASQSIGHTCVDAQALKVDFISFSGHKMLAANGIGILWSNPTVKESLYPIRTGSKSTVKIDNNRFDIDKSNLAGLFECGTQNLPAIFSLKSAIDFINTISLTRIEQYLSYLTHILYNKLKNLPAIEFAPGLANYSCAKGFGIIAFKIIGVSSTDLSQFLDQHRILVRSGDHCLGTQQSEDGDYIRISLHIYNTEEEIDYFIETLLNAIGQC